MANANNVSSAVQWAGKIGVCGVAVYLAEVGKLTPEISAVLSAALLSLGVTNGATLIAKGASLLAAAMPPTSIPPPPINSIPPSPNPVKA
jgi:hypothetical protein